LWETYVPEPRDLRDVLLLSWCLSFYITQIAVDRRCDGLQRGRGGVMIQTNPPQDSVTNGSLHIGCRHRFTAFGHRVFCVVQNSYIDACRMEHGYQGRNRAITGCRTGDNFSLTIHLDLHREIPVLSG